MIPSLPPQKFIPRKLIIPEQANRFIAWKFLAGRLHRPLAYSRFGALSELSKKIGGGNWHARELEFQVRNGPGHWHAQDTNQTVILPQAYPERGHNRALMWKPRGKPKFAKVELFRTKGRNLPTELQADDPRHSKQIPLQVPVRIRLHMPDGRLVQQDGFTLVVTTYGCLVEMESPPQLGQRISLVNPKSGIGQCGTVIDMKKSHRGSAAVTFQFDGPAPHIWGFTLDTDDDEKK